MKYYIVWIEGLEPKTGEKIRAFDTAGDIMYTCLMTDALRVKAKDVVLMRAMLKECGVADWANNDNSYVRTSYAPPGTIWKSKSYEKKRQALLDARRHAKKMVWPRY